MRRLSAYAWRSLAARRLRSLLTTLGIALGVAVLFAALATNHAIDTAVDDTVTAMLGRADLRVAAFTESGLTGSTVEAIGATPGVLAVAPELERRTYLQPGPGSVSTGLRPPVTVLGVDPRVDSQVHPVEIVEGSPLVPGAAGAVISEQLAREDGLGVGDQITLGSAIDPAQSTAVVTGVIRGPGRLPGGEGRLVLVPIDFARALFATEGATRVDLEVAPGATADQVATALEARIRTQPYTLSGPADLAAGLRAATVDIQATTALIAAVALFVGAFLAYNTLSMTISERAREIALLRAAGATRRQVAGLVVQQAAVLGLAGSVLGVVIGYVLAVWLGDALAGQAAAVGGVVPAGASLAPGPMALAIGVGLLVTIASALEPAWRATRITPIESLRRHRDAAPAERARLAWIGVVFLVVGLAGIALWPGDRAAAGLLRAFGVYALLLLVTLLVPIILPAIGRLAGLPFAAVLRAEERLARGAIVRNPGRTALTVSALAIGLAMVVAIGAVAQSDRRAANAWLAETLPGEVLLTSIRPITPEEGIEEQILAVPGVQFASPIGRFDLAVGGTRLDAAAMRGSALFADERLVFVAGDRRAALIALDNGGVAILPRSLASRLGVGLGSPLMALAADGSEVTLEVAGIVERTVPGRSGESVLVGWGDAAASFGILGADAFAVRYAPGQAETATPLVEAAARQLALEPRPLEAALGVISDTLSRLFAVFDVLAAIAVIVAGLGIVNTLTMNVLERVREIGVLRAAGMTRRQIWRMVVVEAGVIGLAGGILGVLLGLVVAAFMLALAGGVSLAASIDPPWLVMALALAFGVVIAMLAAYYPARLASRMSIVRAVQFE